MDITPIHAYLVLVIALQKASETSTSNSTNQCNPQLLCFPLLPSLPQDLQSRELPTTRIQPDRRWFGNTRVIGQKQLEQFRDEMATKINDSYTGTAMVPWTVWHGFPAVFQPSLCVCVPFVSHTASVL